MAGNIFYIHDFSLKVPVSNSAFLINWQNVIYKSPHSLAHIPPYFLTTPQNSLQNNRVHPHQSMIFCPDGNTSKNVNQDHYFHHFPTMMTRKWEALPTTCLEEHARLITMGCTSSLPSINSAQFIRHFTSFLPLFDVPVVAAQGGCLFMLCHTYSHSYQFTDSYSLTCLLVPCLRFRCKMADSVQLGTASVEIQDLASSLEFNEKCGSGIVLSHYRRRAARAHPESEFDNALVFSKTILVERTLFEVVIEKKMTLWSGSLAIGVTKCDPSAFDIVPASISHLQKGTWVLAGSSVLKDGVPIRDDYSANLEELKVSDRVGVMLLEGRELHYFINGRDMGCAVKDIPKQVFVVIDVYGRCSEIKLYSGDVSDDTSSDFGTDGMCW